MTNHTDAQHTRHSPLFFHPSSSLDQPVNLTISQLPIQEIDNCAQSSIMACHSGCCGKPALAPPDQSNPNPALAAMQDDGDSCCDDANPIAGKGLDQPELTGAVIDEPTEEDDCYAPEPAACGCKKGCCSAPKPPRPSCCERKAAPCCDQSCLDRVALRECENMKLGLASHSKLTGPHPTLLHELLNCLLRRLCCLQLRSWQGQ
jgi:hypothetical protein